MIIRGKPVAPHPRLCGVLELTRVATIWPPKANHECEAARPGLWPSWELDLSSVLKMPLIHRLARKSRIISRAALWPGAPVTPPPGWVEAPHMRPGIGIRYRSRSPSSGAAVRAKRFARLPGWAATCARNRSRLNLNQLDSARPVLGHAPRRCRLVAKVPHGHWKTATLLVALRNDRHASMDTSTGATIVHCEAREGNTEYTLIDSRLRNKSGTWLHWLLRIGSKTGVHWTDSTRSAPVASIMSRSKPSAAPLASGISARAARKSSSRG
jgi:hypothetical protein